MHVDQQVSAKGHPLRGSLSSSVAEHEEHEEHEEHDQCLRLHGRESEHDTRECVQHGLGGQRHDSCRS